MYRRPLDEYRNGTLAKRSTVLDPVEAQLRHHEALRHAIDRTVAALEAGLRLYATAPTLAIAFENDALYTTLAQLQREAAASATTTGWPSGGS